jgi:hypothetical protein
LTKWAEFGRRTEKEERKMLRFGEHSTVDIGFIQWEETLFVRLWKGLWTQNFFAAELFAGDSPFRIILHWRFFSRRNIQNGLQKQTIQI